MIKTHQSRMVSRSPIFYGWIVWGVATLGIIATAPGQSFTVSLFIDHFIADFGLDRTTVSGLYGLGTFTAALGLTWVGRQIDFYGNRLIAVIISGLFAAALVAMSFVSGPIGLLFGFIAIRGLGQGSLMLVNTTAVAQWFKNRRGRVMSLSLVAFSLFQSVYVPWLENRIEVMGWRQVWIMLGFGVGVLIVPAIWMFMRNKPEDFGLLPDGQQPAAASQDLELEESWTLGQAQRTSIFWIFIFGRVISPAWGTGLIFHQISIFESLGHESHVAARTFGLVALLSAVMAVVAGVLVDRFRPGHVMTFQMVALTASMALAMVMTEAWMLGLYALAFGIVIGTGGVFDGSVWTNLFGRGHQGVIRGFVTTAMVAGSSLGPVVFGVSYDVTGGYDAVLLVGIVLALIPGLLSLFTGYPVKHQDSVEAI